MWLSRAGVIEQADSVSGPTITSATIAAGTPSTINIVTSENCVFTNTTGISVSTNSEFPLEATGISGSDTTANITLSRDVIGAETIELVIAAVNKIRSVATGLEVVAGTTPVTNNVPVTAPVFIKLTVENSTPNQIDITMNQSCEFASTTGFTLTTDSASALTIVSIAEVVGGPGRGFFTLNRSVEPTETISLTTAVVNGITSKLSGLEAAAGNNAIQNQVQGIAISSIQFTTVSFGTVEPPAGTLTAIPAGDQITTTLHAGNSFTVDTGGLAQYYEGSNPDKQVQHSMLVNYTAFNFNENSLPADGSCVVSWKTDTPPPFAVGGPALAMWPTSGGGAGRFVPLSTKERGMNWTVGEALSGDLSRSDVFETTPTVGTTLFSSYPLAGETAFIVAGDGSTEPNGTEFLNQLPLAAQVLSSSSTVDINIEITMGDGSVLTSTQTVTVPVGAVKENMISLPTYTISQVETVSLVKTPLESLFPQEPIDPFDQLTCTLNAGNSFVAPDNTMYFFTGSITNPSPPPPEFESTAGHSFQVNYDSAPLDPSNFPDPVIFRYVITSSGYGASEIGFLQDGGTFTQTAELELDRSQVITGGVVNGPIISFDNDDYFKITSDLNTTDWSVRVEMVNSAGQTVPSQEQIIQMSANTVIDL